MNPSYTVDTSPLIIVLWRKSRRLILMAASALIFTYYMNQPAPEGISPDGYRSLCILGLAVVLWSTEIIPSGITGILAMVLVSTFVELKQGVTAYQLFGSQALFFLLGSFILSASLRQTGLSNRMALNFLAYFARSPRSLLTIIYVMAIVFSYFMISHGVAAILLPIVLEILLVIHISQLGANGKRLDPNSLADRNRVIRLMQNRSTGISSNNFSKQTLLALSFGCAIGGIGSILGSGRVTIAVEFLEAQNVPVDFARWSLTALPLVVACGIATYLLLMYMFPIRLKHFDSSIERIKVMRKNLGGPSLSEITLLFIIMGTVWALAGFSDPNWTVASIMLMSAIVIFVLNLVGWKDVQNSIDWGIIFMFGGAIVLGTAVSKTDAAGWMVNQLAESLGLTGGPLIVFFLLVGLGLSQILSNSAVFAAFLPVTAQLIQNDVMPGVEMFEFTVALCSILGLAAALPISSPTAALVYSTGYFRTRDMFIPGVVFSLLCFALFVVLYITVWPAWSRLITSF